MNFVKYDRSTGALTSVGQMDESVIEHLKEGGEPILLVPYQDDIDFFANRVDLKTMRLVPHKPQDPPKEDFPPRGQVISDQQFWQQAAIDGLITQDEALEATKTGFIPDPISSWVESIEDDADRFAAEIFFAGATMLSRTDPRIIKAGELFGMTPDELDEFFAAARTL